MGAILYENELNHPEAPEEDPVADLLIGGFMILALLLMVLVVTLLVWGIIGLIGILEGIVQLVIAVVRRVSGPEIV